jgi:hypothetical protein
MISEQTFEGLRENLSQANKRTIKQSDAPSIRSGAALMHPPVARGSVAQI